MTVLLVGLAVLPAMARESVETGGAAPVVAQMSSGAASVDWAPVVEYDQLVLTVTGPDDLVIRRDFKAGQAPSLSLFNRRGQKLPDGDYSYELRVVPVFEPAVRERLSAAREAGNTAAVLAELRKAGKLPPVLVQSGHFQITGGTPVTAATDAVESVAKEVIPEDLIVQGSICVGIDCTATESFGFDTIRLKENNLRIKFDDTSTSAGFPANDWQLTANDSASGGSNKFSIEDITGSKVPFTVTAGAATNSVFVDNIGRVGFRTSTPVLDLHVNTSNTPAIRLEQNNSGGFTAQTWDIGANEANFFVRDVTGGSLLSFRIRPGAPTSSVDIASNGEVGIGTGSPETDLHVFGTNTADTFLGLGPNPDGNPGTESALNIGYSGASNGRGSAFLNVRPDSGATAPNPSLRFLVANTERLIIDNEGFIGLGVANPTSPIHHSTGAILTAGGTWQNASSRATKQDISELAADEALRTVMGLDPVKFAYKVDPKEKHVGFIAEDVPDLVAAPDRKSLSSMDIVAVLTKVVQDQQKTIDEQQATMSEQQKALEALTARLEALEKK
ncbi:MAG TPA: tail fiber domain-containing protein [Thermoanaerobaculia bacterium]|nr:tail fiber domain-containing protein [Thermoanaerobaculia bacterium]